MLRASLLILLAAAGCTPTCEKAMAQKRWALAATQCEKAYLSGHSPDHALATLRAFTQLRKDNDVGARPEWLKGTKYAPAIHYYSAVAARTRKDDAALERELLTCVAETPAAGLHSFGASCARQLAALEWTQAKFHDAFTHLALALTEVRQIDDPILEGLIHGQLADLLSEVGDEAGSARALAVAGDRFKGTFPGGYAQVRLRQGLLELKRGHPNIAHDQFAEARAMSVDAGLATVVRSANLSLANAARALGDFDAGEAYLSAAAAIPAGYAWDDTALAAARARLLLRMERWQDAEATIAASLDAGALPDWQWQLQTLRGEALEHLGAPAAARDAYQSATNTLDTLRATALRPGLLAERRQPYEALFELHVQQGNPRAAIAAMDQLLAASFLERTGAAPMPATELEHSARDALSRLSTIALLNKVQQAQPGAPLDRLAKRDVLAFLTARNHLYRVHAVAGKLDIVQLEPIDALREALDSHPDSPAAADALGRVLWPDTPMSSEVLIIADASLSTLSFAGLRRNGRYLIEAHVLSYAPGFGVAAAVQDRAATGTGVFVFGDPKGDLPGAAAEARQTAAKLEGALCVGPEATIGRLRAACGAQLLHLAAHSGINTDGAWLELADGAITASDLLERRCAPGAVYLASCASAASARKDGAGTLANAFLAAGSRYVVATTRSIDDASAALFTRALFADGKFDQLPVRVATAQRALLKTSPRSTWESFIVLGP